VKNNQVKFIIFFIISLFLFGCEGKERNVHINIEVESELRVTENQYNESILEFEFSTNKKTKNSVKVYVCDYKKDFISVVSTQPSSALFDGLYYFTLQLDLLTFMDRNFISKQNNMDLCFDISGYKPEDCNFFNCSDSISISSNISRIKGSDIDTAIAQIEINDSVLNVNSFNSKKNTLGYFGSGTTLKNYEIVNNFTIYEGDILDRENDAFMEYNFLEEGNLTRYYHSKNSRKVELFSDAGFSYGVSADGMKLFVENADIYASSPLENISTYTLGGRLENGCFSALHHYEQMSLNEVVAVSSAQKSLCGQDSSLVFHGV
jgi:hypothetical protein